MVTVVLVARVLLATAFTVAAVTKLLDLPGSRNALRGFGVPARLTRPAAVILPIAELAIAGLGLMLARVTAVWAGAAALALLVVFSAAVALALAKGRHPDCHCFGQLHSAPAGATTLGRDLALAAVAGFVAIAGWSNPGASTLGWLADVRPAAVVALVGAVLLAAVLAFQAWFSLELLRQNGRLVVRLDAIEQTLAGGSKPRADNPIAGPAAAGMSGLPVGEQAPGFALPDISGELVTLDGLRAGGLPVMLIFSDPGCGPCNALLPRVGEWQKDFADRLTVALVSRGGIEQNRAKAAEHEINNVLVQTDRGIAAQYRAFGTPAALVLDLAGCVASPLAQGAVAIEQLFDRALIDSAALLRVVQSNGSGGTETDGHTAVTPSVGEPAPAVALARLDGRPVALSDFFSGRDLVVLFWNPQCGFCVSMLPQLRAWEAAQRPGAPELLVISTGQPEINQAMGLNSPITLDPDFQAGLAFGAAGTPSATRIDTAGRIAAPLAVGAPGVISLLNSDTASLAA